ncbi:MAG: hypothetical protein OIN85_05030 [Candidatus Methanoperedens sp.]|nr:hypothetical protein [Candidatus Methanoperedens sp.]
MPSEISQKVIDLLSPSIGDFMAKAKVMAACKMANLNIDSMDKSQLKEFAEKFEKVCLPLGPEIAKNLKQKVLAL